MLSQLHSHIHGAREPPAFGLQHHPDPRRLQLEECCRHGFVNEVIDDDHFVVDPVHRRLDAGERLPQERQIVIARDDDAHRAAVPCEPLQRLLVRPEAVSVESIGAVNAGGSDGSPPPFR